MNKQLPHLLLQVRASLFLFSFSVLAYANNVLAQAGGPTLPADHSVNIEPVALANPLAIGSIQDLLIAILNIIVILMIPIIVFFIILAGFKYVTARGNATQIEEATRALLYAIIGGVLVLGASAISAIIANTVAEFTV